MFTFFRQFAKVSAIVAVLASSAIELRAVTVDRYWEVTPYRMKVVVLVDLPTNEANALKASIDEFLNNRIDSAIGPLWKTSIDVRLRQGALPSSPNVELFVDDESRSLLDKILLVRVTSRFGEYQVSGREYDFFASAWGREVVNSSPNLSFVPELVFRVTTEAFSPLATYKVKRGDDASVDISFKGSALPKRGEYEWTPAGALLAPILRKVDNSGEPVAGGTERVKWTYLEIEDTESPATSALVHSHTKKPFGFRQRGRVEQLALLIRDDPQVVTLRLFDRNTPERGLAGLDVFLQNMGEKETKFLGKSDGEGLIDIPPGPTRLRTAYVKSGTLAVAKIPLLPGDLELVEAPLPDHRDRVAAEAKLAAIRENLIDVVAKRAIMEARINRFIEQGDLETARSILAELDDLPGRSQFDQMISREQGGIRTDDPAMEKQIEKMFSDTKGVLNQFLDASLSAKLRSKIIAAETSDTQASN